MLEVFIRTASQNICCRYSLESPHKKKLWLLTRVTSLTEAILMSTHFFMLWEFIRIASQKRMLCILIRTVSQNHMVHVKRIWYLSPCEQRRFRRACASAQSRQNLRCSLIQAVSQEEPSDRKPDPCPSEWLGMPS